MKKAILILFAACMIPSAVAAADFDGSDPLLCAFTKAIECTVTDGCQEVAVEDINLRQFVNINFKNKTVKGTDKDSRKTKIENLEHIDGKLIIQGAEDGIEGVRDGAGWTAAIMKDTGKLVLTASGDQVGFVVFGACTRK
jgi:hypothetical protein